MNFNKRTNTLLYKYISLTLYSRKGDVCCMWEMSWRQGQTAILTQFLLSTMAALLPNLGWVDQPWVTEGPKPSICSWLSLWHPVSSCLEPSGYLVILFSHVQYIICHPILGYVMYIPGTLDFSRMNSFGIWCHHLTVFCAINTSCKLEDLEHLLCIPSKFLRNTGRLGEHWQSTQHIYFRLRGLCWARLTFSARWRKHLTFRLLMLVTVGPVANGFSLN